MAIAEVIEQETVVVLEQDHPADGETETNVTPAGNVSVSTLEVTGAVSCPLFWT
jgi:2-keto-4-pentenoate hydratase